MKGHSGKVGRQMPPSHSDNLTPGRENTFFFKIRSSSCAPPPFLPNLHSNFFSPSCFLSCLIHLFLTFGFSPIINKYLWLLWPVRTLFPPRPIHTKQDTKPQPFFVVAVSKSSITNNTPWCIISQNTNLPFFCSTFFVTTVWKDTFCAFAYTSMLCHKALCIGFCFCFVFFNQPSHNA